jgi:DNA-binding beta-propeller fold protein YncE
MVAVPGTPFAVVTTADGGWSFVSLGSAIGVFSDRSFAPHLVRQIPVPGQAAGEALSHNGRYLLVANDRSGAAVIDVAAAEQGRPHPVVGLLADAHSGADHAVEVAVSPDDRYAFVTREGADDLAVFDLHAALLHGFGPSAFVGAVSLGVAPVGVAVLPTGRWLYATSEARTPQVRTRGSGRHVTASGTGTLSVINLGRAETDPAHAVVTAVAAGCSPVWVITSSDGRVVWVAARGSNAVLGFSAAKLLSDPAHALLARLQVGAAPAGLIEIAHGRRIVVANSNRFGGPRASGTLSVVDTVAALAHRPAVLGLIPAGAFPRQLALEPGGKVLLVTNYASSQVEAVDLSAVP